jgi:signal transduction histidine kinase
MRTLALRLHESERLASLGRLSAGLAHEMRNPANGIVNAMAPLKALLPKEVLASETPTGQLLEVVDSCSVQLATLCRQLLGFVRQGDLATVEITIPDLVRRAIHLAGSALKPVQVVEDLQYAGPIQCAPSFLVQALMNLLDNGAQAAGQGGTLRISTREEAAAIWIEVADSGPGVPPGVRDRIFEPFFTTKDPGKGTGLGLATARQVVEQQGGTLTLLPGPGGAIFRITIPRRSRGAEAAVPRSAIG